MSKPGQEHYHAIKALGWSVVPIKSDDWQQYDHEVEFHDASGVVSPIYLQVGSGYVVVHRNNLAVDGSVHHLAQFRFTRNKAEFTKAMVAALEVVAKEIGAAK